MSSLFFEVAAARGFASPLRKPTFGLAAIAEDIPELSPTLGIGDGGGTEGPPGDKSDEGVKDVGEGSSVERDVCGDDVEKSFPSSSEIELEVLVAVSLIVCGSFKELSFKELS